MTAKQAQEELVEFLGGRRTVAVEDRHWFHSGDQSNRRDYAVSVFSATDSTDLALFLTGENLDDLVGQAKMELSIITVNPKEMMA